MYHSGLGGGGFMLVRASNGTYEFIDFRETAPAAATEDMYSDDIDLSIFGGLARYEKTIEPDHNLTILAAEFLAKFVACNTCMRIMASCRGRWSCKAPSRLRDLAGL